MSSARDARMPATCFSRHLAVEISPRIQAASHSRQSSEIENSWMTRSRTSSIVIVLSKSKKRTGAPYFSVFNSIPPGSTVLVVGYATTEPVHGICDAISLEVRRDHVERGLQQDNFLL